MEEVSSRQHLSREKKVMPEEKYSDKFRDQLKHRGRIKLSSEDREAMKLAL